MDGKCFGVGRAMVRVTALKRNLFVNRSEPRFVFSAEDIPSWDPRAAWPTWLIKLASNESCERSEFCH